jgi:hypothetical protein
LWAHNELMNERHSGGSCTVDPLRSLSDRFDGGNPLFDRAPTPVPHVGFVGFVVRHPAEHTSHTSSVRASIRVRNPTPESNDAPLARGVRISANASRALVSW